MKKLISIVVLTLMIIQAPFVCYAANAVPQEVVSACDSVVRIYANYGNEYALGSGFVISNDNNETLIVTNHHVAVEDEPKELLVLLNVDTDIQATVVASDESKDLAVIKVAFPLGITPITFAENTASKGDAVYAIGYPSAADALSDAIAITNEDSTITDGIISAVRSAKITENGTDTEILQITAAINGGNSGGPLVNEKGEVIGICTYGINDSQGIFGAISSTEIRNFLDGNGIAYKSAINWKIILICVSVLLLVVVAVFWFIKKKRETTDTGTLYEDNKNESYELETEKKITSKKSISKGVRISAGILALIICIVGGYFYSYNKAIEYAKAGDTVNARKYIVAEQITNLHDSNLIPYLDALDAFEGGELDIADAVFASMSGYLNADEERKAIAQEKTRKQAYDDAIQCYKNGEYMKAKVLFDNLSGYKRARDYCYLSDAHVAIEVYERVRGSVSKEEIELLYFYSVDDVLAELEKILDFEDAGSTYSKLSKYYKIVCE